MGSCGFVALASLWSPVNLPVVTDVGRMGVKMGEAAKKSGAWRARLGNVAHIKRSRAPGHSFRERASRHDFFT